MLFKTLCHFIELDNTLENKVFIKFFFLKYLIRYVSIKSFGVDTIIDNLYSIKQVMSLPNLFIKKILTLKGRSFNLKDYSFRSTSNFFCSFKLPYFSTKPFVCNQISSVEKILSQVITCSNKTNSGGVYILLATTVKAGYQVYSYGGLNGFLPRSHSKTIIGGIKKYKNILYSYLCLADNKKYNFFVI